MRKRNAWLSGLILCTLMLPSIACAQVARALFGEFSDRIYQIRIIEHASGKKSGLGSGFLVSADGDIVTNYHVIAEYANQPARYSMEYIGSDAESGPLSLVNVDVVNDLALLRREPTQTPPLRMATELPDHGAAIFSIGNPHDLGWTVIPGTYNGITAHSMYDRIHFSGSINPGMSGGPVLNEAGDVVGVNVATSGNQVSFLIPLNHLQAFLRLGKQETMGTDRVFATVAQQIRENQSRLVQEIIDTPWGKTPFGGTMVPKEIAKFIRCWGESDDDPDIKYKHSATTCNSEEQIYLTRDFNTGNIVYQFNWLETEELSSVQFYKLLKNKIANVYPDNDADKEHVSDYVCENEFVDSLSASKQSIVTKSTFCVRRYLKLDGLYDVLYFSVSVHDPKRSLITHFTMAGVPRDSALSFLAKFTESAQWN